MMWIQYLRDRRASVAPIFAIALLPMLIATGAAIDFSRAFRQRTVVQDALDAAALAAGKKLGVDTDANVKTEAQNFYSTNLGNKLDITPTMTPTITSGQPTLTVTTQLKVPTYFLGIIGIRQFVFNLQAQSTQAMGTLEIALALDNSTSMTLPSSKIATLKSAAGDLATTLWGLAATSTKTDPVKIAVVPFGGAVNIGASTAIANGWVDTAGKGYSTYPTKDTGLVGSSSNASPTSWNPYSIFSTLKDSSGTAISWAGCVEERPAPYDVSDDAPSTSSTPTTEESKTLFEPMIAPDEPDNWNCGTSTCDYIGTTTSSRRFNGTPTGGQTYNNYLPDAGDINTCGTDQETVTITAGSPAPAKFNRSNHGLTAGTSFTLATTGSLPAGLSTSTTYYVSPAGLVSGSFYAATTTTGTSTTVAPGATTLASISNAKPAVFALNSHGLTTGTSITLLTTGTLPAGLSTSTTYYVASTTANNFTVTTASSGTTVTISKASPGVLTTSSNHGLAVGDPVVLATGGSLPSGLSTNTIYYVKTVPTSKTFTVATTSSGSAINTTSNGSGTHSFVKLVATTSAGTGTHKYVLPNTPAVFTSNGHGLSTGDAVALSGSSLPSGLSASTVYYVSGATTNTFTLATGSSSGSPVVLTASGSLNFIELSATTATSQSGTHSYVFNATAYTCANGDCSGSVPGRTETQAFGGQSITSSAMCKYGTTTNKGTVANITVANLSGVGAFGPNFGCSTTAITPLTTNQTTISNAITAMQANGYTNITGGLMWAWRVLSHGAPFTDGRSDDTTDNQKIIVLMTDGENTYNPYLQADEDPSTSTTAAGKFVKSGYGAWGYIASNHLGTTATTSQPIMDKLNARLAAACTAAKAAKIRIYTVGFEINSTTASDPATTKALLQNCATDTTKYFDAQNETDLLTAFTAIGDDISLLRLSM
jgi:Flp pilus assembly protein TadG